MSEFTCDECGTEVADGHGHYIGASHRRYCAECAEARLGGLCPNCGGGEPKIIAARAM